MTRPASRVTAAVASIVLLLAVTPARLWAACPGTATGELTGTGRGEAVSGTLNGAAHTANFSGVIHATVNAQPNVPAFCVNLLNAISVGDCFNTGGATSPQITWLLNHGYGPDDNVPGTTAQKNAENAARQAAVWYFSDGFVTTDAHQARVQQIIDAVPANPDPQADVPQMAIDPPAAVNALPGNLVHTLTVTVTRGAQPLVGQTVSLSTSFGTLSTSAVTTDAAGAATFTLTNTAGTPGTATITGTFGYLLPAGAIFEPIVSGKQMLVLATPTNSTLVANATTQWVSGGTIIAHKFLDSNANATQDPDEPNLANWTMRLFACDTACDGSGCSLLTSAVTDANGDASFGSRAPGCYRVDEVFPTPVPGHQSWHNVTAASQVFSLAGSQAKQVAFGNIIESVVIVQKFNDLNGNGVQDVNDLFLDGWRMMLQRLVNGSWIPLREDVTSDGQVVFSDLPAGHYRVQEELQPGWAHTTPGNPFEFDLDPDAIFTVKFGNTRDCDDHDVCNGLETGDGQGGCVPGAPLQCDDGDACTGVETCNAQTGCVPGVPVQCDDGIVCNGVESCLAGACASGTAVDCTGMADQCNDAACAEPTGTCVRTPKIDGLGCDDGEACTINDACLGGVCVGGTVGGDADADGYCDVREMQAECNPHDPRETPPQANAYSGGRLNTPGEILLTFDSPADRDVTPATSPSCAAMGTCDMTTGFCRAGRIGDPCRVNSDCNQPWNTCRVVMNYSGTPDLQLVEAVLKVIRQPTQDLGAQFNPVTPGCSRKVDITLPSDFRRASLRLKAQGTTGGRKRKDRDRIKYFE